jgi:hypothetical protein
MMCAELAKAYADELAVQVACTPGAQNQCQSRVEAVPGCDCRVPIQPKDPFAIENLFNMQDDWLTADCAPLTCLATCPSGNGRCQADSGSTLGGRCVAD